MSGGGAILEVSRARLLRRVAGVWRHARRDAPPTARVLEDRLPTVDSERLRRTVRDALEKDRPPGAQVVIRRAGGVLWSACAGRVDRTEPVAAEDRFVLASTTKLVTACVVLRLSEQGTLDLDAPVARWVPELEPAGRLTPRLLLAQRSGLREYGRDKGLARRLNGGSPDHQWSRGEVIDAIARLGAEREPGERFAYRNSNYVVAAELAERASGEGFGTLVERLVARPLGLSGFSCAVAVPGTRLSTPHLALLGRRVDLLGVTGGSVPNDAIGPVWGDGGVASSAQDLARFTEALFGGELLRGSTLAGMVARTSRFGRKAGYGLGVMTRRTRAGVIAGHDGMYFGWTASASMDDASATTVVVVANLAGPSVPAARIARAVRAALA